MIKELEGYENTIVPYPELVAKINECIRALNTVESPATGEHSGGSGTGNKPSAPCPLCGIYRCPSCRRPITLEMGGICECGWSQRTSA